MALTTVEAYELARMVAELYKTSSYEEIPDTIREGDTWREAIRQHRGEDRIPAYYVLLAPALDARKLRDQAEDAVLDAQDFIEFATRDDPSAEYTGFTLNARSMPITFAYFMSEGFGNWPYEADWTETVKSFGFHPKSRTSADLKAQFDKFIAYLEANPDEESKLIDAQDRMIAADEGLRRVYDEIPRLLALGYRAQKGSFPMRVPESLTSRIPVYLSTSANIEDLEEHILNSVLESEPRSWLPRVHGEPIDSIESLLESYAKLMLHED